MLEYVRMCAVFVLASMALFPCLSETRSSSHPYEIQLEESEGRVRLKEKLFRLLGYNALKELEESIGSKYGILVGYDNGKKAYTGGSELRVKVPEGASKIEWIKIISIEVKGEKELSRLLHLIIEAEDSGNLGKVRDQIGKAGERIVIGGEAEGIDYKRDILEHLSKKTSVPLSVLESNVRIERLGGGGEPDGAVIANNE